MVYLDPTYREQTGPDADTGRRQSQLLESYLNNAWVSYTPVLTGTVSNPTLGTTGSITGKYKRLGSTCFGRVVVVWGGTGITQGSGEYQFNVPFATDTADARYVQGRWMVNLGTNGLVCDPQMRSSTTKMGGIYVLTNGGSAFTALGTATATWAAGMAIDANFTYEVGK